MAEIESGLQRRTPDWQARMAAWEEQVRNDQPEWRVLQLTVDDISTGGERELPMKDGSMLAQGYAPTKHNVKFTAKPDLAGITAVRLELLTDPDLPGGGPGRSIKGSGALTEFAVEAPAAEEGKFEKLKIASATADLNMPEAVLEPKFDDKSGKRRVTGPIEYAIDGKDETAWTLDAGPGLRNQARKAVFVLEKPVTAGTLNLYLKMNHGGANSDDNENNNLGRIRLSRHQRAGAHRRPGAASRARAAGDSARATHPGADRRHLPLLAHHRPRMARGQRACRRRHARVSGRRAATGVGCPHRRSSRDPYFEARRFSSARTRGHARRAGLPQSAARGESAASPTA